MQKTNLTMTLAALALGASTLVALPARAHINVVGMLKSRGGDEKHFPCDGKRGDGPVYTFQPGATITIGIDEAIAHPSYFRIAFDNDGEDGFVEPKSIKPIDSSRKCPSSEHDQCGDADYCNVVSTDGATVLWDNLNPHLANAAKSLTWNVKLPDIECDNCTIQVIQVMEDDAFHGPYCPSDSCKEPSGYVEDLYHRCIDIKLVKGATNSPGTTTAPVNNMGMQCTAKDAPPTTTASDAGVATATDAGATTTTKTDAGAAKDAGGAKPAAKDAGSSATGGGSSDDQASDDGASDDDTSATGSTKDAGKGTKKDAGSSSSSDDDSDTAKPAKVDDGGCSVAASRGSASGALWSLLALSALLVRRKRDRAA
jgi:MYXO-CTERM domain-containing protein